MHATVELFGKSSDDWQSLFVIKPFNTAGLTPDDLAKTFRDAQDSYDVVFGPTSSQQAIEILINRKEKVRVPTIITTAATTRIRDHDQYGKLLLQLSPSIDTYSQQYMRFVGEFLEPHPKHVLVIARQDEYGRSSVLALSKYAAIYRIAFEQIEYPLRSQQITEAVYTKDILKGQSAILSEIARKPDEWVVLIADTGTMLTQLAASVRKSIPKIRIGTLSSPDDEEVATGAFEGMYLIYSFTPVQFSLDTLAFYQYAHQSQPYMDALLEKPYKPKHWPRLETVDAEVHDATVFWIQRFATSQLNNSVKSESSKNLYVCNFWIRGGGRSLGNEGALYLFTVRNKKIVPVEIPRD